MHPVRDIRTTVHGDNFAILGDDDALNYVEQLLRTKYELKRTGNLGPEPNDDKEVTILNRYIRYAGNSLHPEVHYEADPRHAELIVQALGLDKSNTVATPSVKHTRQEVEKAALEPPLPASQATLYRSLVMRGAYLSQDRADLGEPCKQLARRMQAPTASDLADLKRLGRYLKGKPRVVTKFTTQSWDGTVTVYVDSDHAGCLVTRKSTTGLIAFLGTHCVKHSSNLQSTIALSSGESEFYGLVKAGATGLGLRSLLEDWGIETHVRLRTDSSAAKATTSRLGLGKL